MHRFADLIGRCVGFTLHALGEAERRLHEEFQTSAATRLVKNAQMIQLQRAISAVGMFSIFEATLQDGLSCSDGFREASTILEQAGETDLKDRFRLYQLATNVLKHGRGRSYDELVARADTLPFRIKRPTEHFFNEGDVSEVNTLIEVTDDFVIACAAVIHDVSCIIRAQRADFLH